MPSIPADIGTLINNSEFYFRYLPIKNIYIAGSASISDTIKNANDSRLIFMNENEFCDIKRLREIYLSRTDVNPSRLGWYIQQFIKIQFARMTDDEYYLIWDSDTVPLKPISLFDPASGKPFMRCGYVPHEIYGGYLDTHARILPDVKNTMLDVSFIREHMTIKTEYMRELMGVIESNGNFSGDNFQEKIFHAMKPEFFMYGFSEFQEYGIFISFRHPEDYVMNEDWRSLRTGQRFWDNASSISPQEISWLATKYDAISIEKWQKPTKLTCFAHSKIFRAIFPPTALEYIAKPARLLIPRKHRAYLHHLAYKIKSFLTQKKA